MTDKEKKEIFTEELMLLVADRLKEVRSKQKEEEEQITTIKKFVMKGNSLHYKNNKG